MYNINELLAAGAVVHVHDPEAMENVRGIYGDKIQYYTNPYQAAEHADALLIATGWPEYRRPDFERLKAGMKGQVIFDGRNLYSPEDFNELGFTYYSIGRKFVIS